MEITKEFRFEASHLLPRHPGKCSRLHGHSWVLKVSVSGDINPTSGFVMDYADITSAVIPVVDQLDHRHLGQWTNKLQPDNISWSVFFLGSDFYPSSENLIVWIGAQIDDQAGKKFWSKLELNETCTSGCILMREEYERIKSQQ